MFRSLLECTFRIAYVKINPIENHRSLELKDLEEKIKALKHFSDGSTDIESLKSRVAELKAAGAKNHSFKDMLKITGHEAWYPVFSMASNVAHGQITGIANQFLSTENGKKSIVLFAPLEQQQRDAYLLTTSQLLDAAFENARAIFGVPNGRLGRTT
ncbi:MAG: hypothetical protein JNN20_17330 [Betaproteobacteria bacterium]|nr:hypothetical protein [Betaproteobacteria bacterium]